MHEICENIRKNADPLYKTAVGTATDFSWLPHGDRVLVKLSLNSGNRLPATTDPWSADCMIRLLKEKGAGSIWVGDRGSYGAVQWTQDTKQGSTRQPARQAGLLKAIESSDAEPSFLEESGWDAYRPAWPEGELHNGGEHVYAMYEEINRQPDSSAMAYLNNQINT